VDFKPLPQCGAQGRQHLDVRQGKSPGRRIARKVSKENRSAERLRPACTHGLDSLHFALAPDGDPVGVRRRGFAIADEHVATEISTRVLALQHEAQRLVHSRGHHRVLLAAPGGEQHLVALRMIANLLQDAGYEVIMLGAEVSGDALVEALSRHRPHVICVSATLPPGADELPGLIQRLREHDPLAGFVIGGRGLDPTVIGELSTLPRTRACQRVSEIVEAVDALVKRADLN